MNGNTKLVLTILIGLLLSLFSWGGYNLVAQGNEVQRLCVKVENVENSIEKANMRDAEIIRKLDQIVSNTNELKTDVEVLKHDVQGLERNERRRQRGTINEGDH